MTIRVRIPARGNPPPSHVELAILGMRGYVRVWTPGDGITHNGVVDELEVQGETVMLHRSITPLTPPEFIKLTFTI